MSSTPVALITGGGSGIGAATARQMAHAGFRVALLGRTRARLERVAGEIRDGGHPEPLVIPCRQELEAEAELAVSLTHEAHGRLDVLVNNAAIFEPGAVRDATAEHWSTMLAINLQGPVFLSRAALPFLEETRGVIVNVSSTLGERPVAGYAAYSASKAALISLTRSLALEEASRGIRAVAICPGVVDTPIHGDEGRPEKMAAMAEMHPLGRVGTPDEVAGLVLHLCGEHSRWITGSVFTIDGGISL